MRSANSRRTSGRARPIRIPRFLAGILFTLSSVALSGPAAAGVFPTLDWASATPSAVQLDAGKLAELASLTGGSGVVIRHGYLVHTWGDPTAFTDWASASKPVLSTLLMLAETQGLCAMTDTMGDWLEGGTAKDRAISFLHLANNVSGYSRGENAGDAWAYNDYAINLYGYALCEEVYDATPSSVVSAQLGFLGFQDQVTVSDVQYGRIKRMSIRDYARLGLLWLNEGNWNGTQVIPSGYFDLGATVVDPATPPTMADGSESWNLGTFGGSDDQEFFGPGYYGMNFWVNANDLWPSYATDIYQANGHNGQKVCFVVPGLDIVAAGIGTWGAPGDPVSRNVLSLLHEADLGPPVSVGAGVRETSWARVKAGYRDASATGSPTTP